MKIGLEAPNGFPSHFAPQPHKYLEQTQARIPTTISALQHPRRQFNPYSNNEGTVVAVAGEDFVVVGGDTRLSEGYSLITRN